MSVARRLTSSYESSENGAAWPGRWHVAQCPNTIGAISAANVGTGLSAAPSVTAPPASSAATRIRECTNCILRRCLALDDLHLHPDRRGQPGCHEAVFLGLRN